MMTSFKKHRRDASFYLLSNFENHTLKNLCQLARFLDIHRAIPATSSNFSMRCDTNSFLISKSGLHKRALNPSHFVRVDLAGKALSFISPKPSDETLLHALIYREFPEACVVAHSHAREFDHFQPPAHVFKDHELLKIFGSPTHETTFSLPVFKNSQDMPALSQEVDLYLQKNKESFHVGFMLEKHGIYCFGKNVEQVQYYLEALLHLTR